MNIINDFSIIESKPIQIIDGCNPYRKVLRHIPENQITPYVIHMENLEIAGNAFVHKDFYRGRYFPDLESAKQEFFRF